MDKCPHDTGCKACYYPIVDTTLETHPTPCHMEIPEALYKVEMAEVSLTIFVHKNTSLEAFHFWVVLPLHDNR